jgi:hypothetical protein
VSAEEAAFWAAARIELYGQQQQAAGAAGADPLSARLLELVSELRDALPGSEESDLVSIGQALFEWSAAAYQLGAAEAPGAETFEDGLRIGEARAAVTRAREAWLLPLLAEYGRGHHVSLTDPLDGLDPDARVWVLDAAEEVANLKRENGTEDATHHLVSLIRSAPTEHAAAALSLHVAQAHGVWLNIP